MINKVKPKILNIFILKSLSVLTLIIFSTSNLAIAQGTGPVPSDPGIAFSAPSGLELPSDLGDFASKEWKGAGSPLVIFIRDAHSVVDAQDHIRDLIQYFQEKYGIDLVALEGGTGKEDTTLLRAFPEMEVKKKVLRGYLERGELTGGEMSSIFNVKEMKYVGIETWPLYEGNYAAYLKTVRNEEKVMEKLGEIWRDLDEKRKSVYTEEMNEFHETEEAFQSETMGLLEFLKYLKGLKGVEGKLLIGGELEKLFASIEKDKEMSGKDLGSEIRRSGEEFKRKHGRELSKEEAMEWNGKFQGFVTGSLEGAGFLKYMEEIAKKKGWELELSAGMKEMLGHAETMGTIRGTKLFEELESLVLKLEDEKTVGEGAKEISKKYRQVRLMEEMSVLEIDREQYEEYVKNRSEYRGMMGELMDPAEDFYGYAVKRDEALHANMMKVMEKERSKGVVVVLGGFHTKGFERKLKESGYSYGVVTPKMASLKGHERYGDVMGGNVSYREYLRTTFYDAFVRASGMKLVSELNEPEMRRVLKHWRDEVLRKLGEEGRLAQAGEYTKYIDELTKVYMGKYGESVLSGRTKEQMLQEIEKELLKARDEMIDKKWDQFAGSFRSLTQRLTELTEKKQITKQKVEESIALSGRSEQAVLQMTLATFTNSPITITQGGGEEIDTVTRDLVVSGATVTGLSLGAQLQKDLSSLLDMKNSSAPENIYNPQNTSFYPETVPAGGFETFALNQFNQKQREFLRRAADGAESDVILRAFEAEAEAVKGMAQFKQTVLALINSAMGLEAFNRSSSELGRRAKTLGSGALIWLDQLNTSGAIAQKRKDLEQKATQATQKRTAAGEETKERIRQLKQDLESFLEELGTVAKMQGDGGADITRFLLRTGDPVADISTFSPVQLIIRYEAVIKMMKTKSSEAGTEVLEKFYEELGANKKQLILEYDKLTVSTNKNQAFDTYLRSFQTRTQMLRVKAEDRNRITDRLESYRGLVEELSERVFKRLQYEDQAAQKRKALAPPKEQEIDVEGPVGVVSSGKSPRQIINSIIAGEDAKRVDELLILQNKLLRTAATTKGGSPEALADAQYIYDQLREQEKNEKLPPNFRQKIRGRVDAETQRKIETALDDVKRKGRLGGSASSLGLEDAVTSADLIAPSWNEIFDFLEAEAKAGVLKVLYVDIDNTLVKPKGYIASERQIQSSVRGVVSQLLGEKKIDLRDAIQQAKKVIFTRNNEDAERMIANGFFETAGNLDVNRLRKLKDDYGVNIVGLTGRPSGYVGELAIRMMNLVGIRKGTELADVRFGDEVAVVLELDDVLFAEGSGKKKVALLEKDLAARGFEAKDSIMVDDLSVNTRAIRVDTGARTILLNEADPNYQKTTLEDYQNLALRSEGAGIIFEYLLNAYVQTSSAAEENTVTDLAKQRLNASDYERFLVEVGKIKNIIQPHDGETGSSYAPAAAVTAGSLGELDNEQIKKILSAAYVQFLGYVAEIGRLAYQTGRGRVDPGQEGEVLRARKAYVDALVREGNLTDENAAVNMFERAMADSNYKLGDFYRVSSDIREMGKRGEQEIDIFKSDLREAVRKRQEVAGKEIVKPKVSVFTQEGLLKDTPLWETFKAINKGKDPATVYLSGTREQIYEQLASQTANVNNEDYVYISVEYPVSGRTFYINLIEKAARLRAPEDINRILALNFKLNDHPFHLTFIADNNLKVVHLHKVSLGGGSIDRAKIQGKGLMRGVFANTEKLLRENFKDWRMTTVAAHNEVEKFMRRFNSRVIFPGQSEEKLVDSFETIIGTMNREDVQVLVGNIRGQSLGEVTAEAQSIGAEIESIIDALSEEGRIYRLGVDLVGLTKDQLPRIQEYLGKLLYSGERLKDTVIVIRAEDSDLLAEAVRIVQAAGLPTLALVPQSMVSAKNGQAALGTSQYVYVESDNDSNALRAAFRDISTAVVIENRVPSSIDDFVRVFGTPDALTSNINEDIVQALSKEWEVQDLDLVKRRIGNALAVYNNLARIRAQTKAVFKDFERANTDAGQTAVLADSAEVTHNSFFRNEVDTMISGGNVLIAEIDGVDPSFIRQDTDLGRAFLARRDNPKWKGKLTLSDVKPERRVEFLKALLNQQLLNLDEKRSLYLEALGLPEEAERRISAMKERIQSILAEIQVIEQEPSTSGQVMLERFGKSRMNTVAQPWTVLQEESKLYLGNEKQEARRTAVYNLQTDSIGTILGILTDPAVIDGLRVGSGESKRNVLIDALRKINAVWRMNNPWGGFDDQLIRLPFDVEENKGIGVNEILKDAVVLKAVLEVLNNAIARNEIQLPEAVKVGLSEAFRNGLDEVLNELIQKEKLKQAVIDNRVADEFSQPASRVPQTMEEFVEVFGRPGSIDANINEDIIKALAEQWNEKDLTVVKNRIRNALEIYNNLTKIRDTARTTFKKFELGIVEAGRSSVLSQAAEQTHNSFFRNEVDTMIRGGNVLIAEIDGMDASFFRADKGTGPAFLARRSDPKWKGKIKLSDIVEGRAADFLRTLLNNQLSNLDGKQNAYLRSLGLPTEAAGRIDGMKTRIQAILSRIDKLERKAPQLLDENLRKELGSLAINTVGQPWEILQQEAALYETDEKQQARRNKLYGLQTNSVATVVSTLMDQTLLGILKDGSQDDKRRALIGILRKINVLWRLENPWGGFRKNKLQFLPFALEENGGIGLEEILKDAVVLKVILEVLRAEISGLNEAFQGGLSPLLDELVDREQLKKAVKENQVEEKFTANSLELGTWTVQENLFRLLLSRKDIQVNTSRTLGAVNIMDGPWRQDAAFVAQLKNYLDKLESLNVIGGYIERYQAYRNEGEDLLIMLTPGKVIGREYGADIFDFRDAIHNRVALVKAGILSDRLGLRVEAPATTERKVVSFDQETIINALGGLADPVNQFFFDRMSDMKAEGGSAIWKNSDGSYRLGLGWSNGSFASAFRSSVDFLVSRFYDESRIANSAVASRKLASERKIDLNDQAVKAKIQALAEKLVLLHVESIRDTLLTPEQAAEMAQTAGSLGAEKTRVFRPQEAGFKEALEFAQEQNLKITVVTGEGKRFSGQLSGNTVKNDFQSQNIVLAKQGEYSPMEGRAPWLRATMSWKPGVETRFGGQSSMDGGLFDRAVMKLVSVEIETAAFIKRDLLLMRQNLSNELVRIGSSMPSELAAGDLLRAFDTLLDAPEDAAVWEKYLSAYKDALAIVETRAQNPEAKEAAAAFSSYLSSLTDYYEKKIRAQSIGVEVRQLLSGVVNTFRSTAESDEGTRDIWNRLSASVTKLKVLDNESIVHEVTNFLLVEAYNSVMKGKEDKDLSAAVEGVFQGVRERVKKHVTVEGGAVRIFTTPVIDINGQTLRMSNLYRSESMQILLEITAAHLENLLAGKTEFNDVVNAILLMDKRITERKVRNEQLKVLKEAYTALRLDYDSEQKKSTDGRAATPALLTNIAESLTYLQGSAAAMQKLIGPIADGRRRGSEAEAAAYDRDLQKAFADGLSLYVEAAFIKKNGNATVDGFNSRQAAAAVRSSIEAFVTKNYEVLSVKEARDRKLHITNGLQGENFIFLAERSLLWNPWEKTAKFERGFIDPTLTDIVQKLAVSLRESSGGQSIGEEAMMSALQLQVKIVDVLESLQLSQLKSTIPQLTDRQQTSVFVGMGLSWSLKQYFDLYDSYHKLGFQDDDLNQMFTSRLAADMTSFVRSKGGSDKLTLRDLVAGLDTALNQIIRDNQDEFFEKENREFEELIKRNEEIMGKYLISDVFPALFANQELTGQLRGNGRVLFYENLINSRNAGPVERISGIEEIYEKAGSPQGAEAWQQIQKAVDALVEKLGKLVFRGIIDRDAAKQAILSDLKSYFDKTLNTEFYRFVAAAVADQTPEIREAVLELTRAYLSFTESYLGGIQEADLQTAYHRGVAELEKGGRVLDATLKNELEVFQAVLNEHFLGGRGKLGPEDEHNVAIRLFTSSLETYISEGGSLGVSLRDILPVSTDEIVTVLSKLQGQSAENVRTNVARTMQAWEAQARKNLGADVTKDFDAAIEGLRKEAESKSLSEFMSWFNNPEGFPKFLGPLLEKSLGPEGVSGLANTLYLSVILGVTKTAAEMSGTLPLLSEQARALLSIAPEDLVNFNLAKAVGELRQTAQGELIRLGLSELAAAAEMGERQPAQLYVIDMDVFKDTDAEKSRELLAQIVKVNRVILTYDSSKYGREISDLQKAIPGLSAVGYRADQLGKQITEKKIGFRNGMTVDMILALQTPFTVARGSDIKEQNAGKVDTQAAKAAKLDLKSLLQLMKMASELNWLKDGGATGLNYMDQEVISNLINFVNLLAQTQEAQEALAAAA